MLASSLYFFLIKYWRKGKATAFEVGETERAWVVEGAFGNLDPDTDTFLIPSTWSMYLNLTIL